MKDKGNNKWVALLKVIGIIAILAFLVNIFGDKKTEQQNPIERHFSKFDGSYTKFRNYVKDNLNNPSSFEHVETRYIDNNDGTAKVIMKYRGQNGFGAIITKYAKCTLNVITGDFSEVVYD